MPFARPCIVSLVLILCLLTAGCTSFLNNEAGSTNTTKNNPQSNASYQVTISQPDARSDFIHMDSDVYNAGEVVEFSVTNDGLIPLACSSTPPGYRVDFQTGQGRWTTKYNPDGSARKNTSFLQKGESTPVSRIISGGWEPGRYRIVSDCGIEHEILVRAQPTLVPTPVANISSPAPASLLWIKIDPFGDPLAFRPFMIQGTTNISAGQELTYAIIPADSYAPGMVFPAANSFVTIVEEGSSGINQWRAMGEIQTTGDFVLVISDAGKKAIATKRFTVAAS